MYNVLICDDERDIRAALNIYLSGEGYSVIETENGADMLRKLEENDVHLVLLDIMMPVMDGYTSMVQLRKFSNVPVILLTAKGEDTDKILGLNVGADDYIVKPFNPVELLARVKAQVRRYMRFGGGERVDLSDSLINGGLELNDKQKRVILNGEEISLTPTEYDLLQFFMKNVDTVFSPKDIYRNVWDDDPFGAENTVTVHIRHLREKIEINPSEPRYIKVVWGHGYKMTKLS